MSNSRRQDIINQFCILYEIVTRNGYPSFKPSIQKPLRARIEKLTELHPEWGERHYVQHFLSILNEASQPELERRSAHLHLIAYFDLSRCHFIRKFSQKLPFPEATLIKLFDLTTESLYNPDEVKKILNRYNEQDARGASLKTYMQGVFKNIILKTLNLESSWHILCNADFTNPRKFNNSKQNLREALERHGVVEPILSRYIFAWQYFVPVYKNNRLYRPNRSDKKKWPDAEYSDFEEAARDYNANRFQSDAPLQVSSSPQVKPETLRQWMNSCIDALQQYSQLVEIYSDEDTDKIQDYLSVISLKNVESEPEQEPEIFLQKNDPFFEQEIKRIENSLDKIRSKIPLEVRKGVMPLCYPHELSLLVQEQFANKVGVNQGTVARYISNTYKVPLLAQFDQLLDINLGTDSRTWSQNRVEQFLEKRFSNPNSSDLIETTIVDAIQTLDKYEQMILKLYYGQKMTVEEIANYINKEGSLETTEIVQGLRGAKQELEEAILAQLTSLKLEYVSAWLKRHYKQVIHTQLIDLFNQLELPMIEIIQLRYCQRFNEKRIESIKSTCNVRQEISYAKQQLENHIIQWIYETFSISIEPEREQVSEVVEIWFNTLYSVEL